MRWEFPELAGGQVRGVADAGIETFSAHMLRSLARETCQNSLDAALTGTRPVRVEFVRQDIDKELLPGNAQLGKSILQTVMFWRKHSPNKAKTMLEGALNTLQKTPMSILRISDYETTGLSRPYSDDFQGGWSYLTKVDGGATKFGGTSGNFGIGKNAPFSASAFRVVFYRTLNTDSGPAEKTRAAQGVARLPSFPLDQQRQKDTMTAGIGYYGDPKMNMPVEKIEKLEQISTRRTTGTDLFVYGFLGGKDWAQRVAGEVLNNFLIAIWERKLVVLVEDKKTGVRYELSGDTLDQYLPLLKDAKDARDFHKVLCSPDTRTFTHDMPGGMAKLQLLRADETPLNRRILVVRNGGMRLFLLNRFLQKADFSGILTLEGSGLNEYFRAMEPPTHDAWTPERHDNPKEAEKRVAEVKRWARRTVNSEMVGLLQTTGAPGTSVTKQQEPAGAKDRHTAPTPDTAGEGTQNGRPKTGVTQLSPKPGSLSRAKTAGEELENAEDGTRWKRISGVKNCRVIELGQTHLHRVMFALPRETERAAVVLQMMGDCKNGGQANIAEIRQEPDGIVCRRVGNHAELENVPAGETVRFDVRIDQPGRVNMEVDVYAPV